MYVAHRLLKAKIVNKLVIGLGSSGYGIGLYLIYDSYRKLSESKQDLKIFEPMATKLIYEGTYQYTRNPMYLGGILTLSGGWILTFILFPFFSKTYPLNNKMMHLSLASLLFASMYYINVHIIPYEEQQCLQKYGDVYTVYKQQVPRWLFR